MFDVDDFKAINDSFGHANGDLALQKLTQAIRSQLRAVDVFGRYGGDEFIALLPRTTMEEARIVGERMRASVAAIHIEAGQGILSLTISLGIVQSTHLDDSIEHLFLRADQALYAAKSAGRNRLITL